MHAEAELTKEPYGFSPPNPQRRSWRRPTGWVLSCIGFAAGLYAWVMANLVGYVPWVEAKATAVWTGTGVGALFVCGVGCLVFPRKRPGLATTMMVVLSLLTLTSLYSLKGAVDRHVKRTESDSSSER